MSDSSCINEESLASIRKLGGDTLLHKMIGLFLEHAPGRLESLHAAHRKGDLPAVSAAAHSIKSSAGNFGALKLSSTADTIETLAGSGEADRLPELIRTVDEAYAAVKERLERELDA